ncbi:hypothetical protein TNCV_135241 [Trichonephila clavipes]|nr:hypothetical protein TNCV_135241 [Trichonephila clavipes]
MQIRKNLCINLQSYPENFFTARLSSLIIPALQEQQCLQTTVFMQDGATPHIGHQVKALLCANFDDNRDYPEIFRMHGLLAHPT